MIGVSTETAIRLLARLKRKQLIETYGREVVIMDAARLARLAAHGSINSPRSPASHVEPNGARAGGRP